MASAASATPTSATGDAPKLIKKASTTDAKTPITPTQTSFGCPHVKSLLTSARNPAVEGYTRAIKALQREGNVTDRLVKKSGGVTARGEVTYLCLQCPNVTNVRERHRDNHNFAIESANGFVYCHECKDFVYDPTFEEVRSDNNSNSKKRKHKHAFQDGDKKLMSVNATATSCAATGLRGLYNMGQTCFMSVVLQSLIHNPFIRTFYLSEGHRSIDCEREACTSCALDDIFTDFYGFEKHEGYGAVHMLQGCWKGGGGLAGYSQQDAHEYLGFILNSLHEAITEDDDKAKKDDLNCSCVIHQTFGGTFKSTVSCASCRNTTAKIEPFMDLSLDIEQAAFTTKKKKLPLTNGTQTVRTLIPVDLVDCLDRFTTAETLSGDTYHCRKCDATRTAMKKLSLTQLPPVIPIHLKRFSHNKSSTQSNKINTKVRFPLTLDMSAYLSPSPPKTTRSAESKAGEKEKDKEKDKDGEKDKDRTNSNGNGEKKTAAKKGDDEEGDEDTINVRTPNRKLPVAVAHDEGAAEPQTPVYDLSSVVVHKGKIDSGHYISYSKQDREWFRFDDSMVVQVNEKEVLNAEAYMLFYIITDI